MPTAPEDEPGRPVRDGPVLSRRHLLTRIAPLAALGLAAAACGSTGAAVRRSGGTAPLALVYRGPASSSGTPEAAAALLRTARPALTTAWCGPDEELPLTRASLDRAALYVQPGGGDDLDAAWAALEPAAGALRSWVADGGRYLGICMGGFLAGSDPGFGLLPGDSGEYTATPGATVHDNGDALVDLSWRGTHRSVYFQGGPDFVVDPGRPTEVVARYANGAVAAVVTPFGSGRVGVIGPHPEAPVSWYEEAGLAVPDPMPTDLGHDLVRRTTAR